MRDFDVRAAVRRLLHANHDGDADTRIVEEMGIWSGTVRIDIAVINGELHGYELKSARDTLERLPAQVELYSQVFDRVTLVIADRHVSNASKLVPGWWGIIVAVQDTDKEVTLRETTRPKPNCSVEAVQLSRLLWRSEALSILERYGIDRGVRSRAVNAMHLRLAEELSLKQLSAEVRAVLKARSGWLGQAVSDER